MPFPFSLTGSFEIQIPSEGAAEAVPKLTDAISEWLAENRANSISRAAHGVAFKAGLLRMVPGWNNLAQVSSGEIEFARQASIVQVRYHLHFTELLTFVIGWLWLVGLNYLLMRYRIPRALRRVTRAATDGDIR